MVAWLAASSLLRRFLLSLGNEIGGGKVFSLSIIVMTWSMEK
jgi:hypothetical protein